MHLDAVIIGAGINGLLSALHLAREGLRVGIVERGEPARESTWAGAGILSPLLPWDYGMEVNALCLRGSKLWPGWIESLRGADRIDPEYVASGMLALSVADLSTALAWCRENAWRAEAAGAAPAGAEVADESGIWLPDVAQVRNPRLAQALTAACREAGIHLWTNTPAQGWTRRDSRIEALHTTAGELRAGAYVACAGAWSRSLLAEAVGCPDIHPVRGQILQFQAAPGLLPCILYQEGRYLVPRRDGLILAGSTLEHVGFDKSTTREALDDLLTFSLKVLPALRDAKLVRHWAGLRPGSPGNIPTISAHPSIDNLYINSGHYRYGVTMAPASAELLCDLMLNRTPAIYPTPYRWPQ